MKNQTAHIQNVIFAVGLVIAPHKPHKYAKNYIITMYRPAFSHLIIISPKHRVVNTPFGVLVNWCNLPWAFTFF